MRRRFVGRSNDDEDGMPLSGVLWASMSISSSTPLSCTPSASTWWRAEEEDAAVGIAPGAVRTTTAVGSRSTSARGR